MSQNPSKIIRQWVSFLDQEDVNQISVKGDLLGRSITVPSSQILDGGLFVQADDLARGTKAFSTDKPVFFLFPCIEAHFRTGSVVYPVFAVDVTAQVMGMAPSEGGKQIVIDTAASDGFYVIEQVLSTILGMDDDEVDFLEVSSGLKGFAGSLGDSSGSSSLKAISDAVIAFVKEHVKNSEYKLQVRNSGLLTQVEMGTFSGSLRFELEKLVKLPIASGSAAAQYLFPVRTAPAAKKKVWLGHFDPRVIYGKGQAKALSRIHSERLVAVQGPPGTGKTAMILGAIANNVVRRAVNLAGRQGAGSSLNGLTLVVSDTNKAVSNVVEKLQKRFPGDSFCFEGGRKEKNKAEMERVVRKIEWLSKQVHSAVRYEEAREKVFSLALSIWKGKTEYDNLQETLNVKQKAARDLERDIQDLRLAVAAKESGLKKDLPKIEVVKAALCDATALFKEITSPSFLDRLFGRVAGPSKRISDYVQDHVGALAAVGCHPVDTDDLQKAITSLSVARDAIENVIRVEGALLNARRCLESLSGEHRDVVQSITDVSAALRMAGDFYEEYRLDLEAVEKNLELFDASVAFLELEAVRNKKDVIASLDGFVSGRWVGDFKKTAASLSLVYPVFSSTLNSIRNILPLAEGIVDLCIVDEAGQIPCHKLFPAIYRSSRVLVVGDPKQLPPVIALSAKQIESYHAKWEGFDRSEVVAWSPATSTAYDRAAGLVDSEEWMPSVLLDEHRRCAGDIADLFVKIADYEGLQVLTSFETGKTSKRTLEVENLIHEELQGARMIGYQVDGINNQTVNASEVEAVAAAIDRLATLGFNPGTEIGVVTPFKAQVAKLREKLKGVVGADNIGTAHVFQGKEFPVIIFSPVVATKNHPSFSFVDGEPNLLNVAVSRAMQLFVVVGNLNTLGRTNGNLRLITDHIRERGLVVEASREVLVEVQDSAELVRGLEHIDHFELALENVRKSLIIETPWIRGEAAEMFISKLPALLKRGVDVKVYFGYNEIGDDNDPVMTARIGALLGSNLIRIPSGTHEKVLLVDSEVAVVGSWNWLSNSYISKAKKAEAKGIKNLCTRREISVVMRGDAVEELAAEYRVRSAA